MTITAINSPAGIKQRVRDYAKTRWCWDDESHLDELVDDYTKRGLDLSSDKEIKAFVDGLAEHYDLTDPNGAWS